MKRRFVIATNPLDPPQSNQITKLFDGYGWWHWIDGLWLVVDQKNQLDVSKITDQIHAIDSSLRFLVIEIAPGGTWAGAGSKEPKNMFDWLQNSWKL